MLSCSFVLVLWKRGLFEMHFRGHIVLTFLYSLSVFDLLKQLSGCSILWAVFSCIFSPLYTSCPTAAKTRKSITVQLKWLNQPIRLVRNSKVDPASLAVRRAVCFELNLFNERESAVNRSEKSWNCLFISRGYRWFYDFKSLDELTEYIHIFNYSFLSFLENV